MCRVWRVWCECVVRACGARVCGMFSVLLTHTLSHLMPPTAHPPPLQVAQLLILSSIVGTLALCATSRLPCMFVAGNFLAAPLLTTMIFDMKTQGLTGTELTSTFFIGTLLVSVITSLVVVGFSFVPALASITDVIPSPVIFGFLASLGPTLIRFGVTVCGG